LKDEKGSCGNSEFSWLEVGGLLGSSSCFQSGLVLGETSSLGFGSFPSEILWGVSGFLELILGLSSLLLTEHGENFSNSFSDNLYRKNNVKRSVHH
jgi:hypothetical protein